ncbi:hypothetical protein [Chondrinema litorale]|uniref:hypothetical protein n=1 Tax=Chondrinema litorale TaxID=2994555 RepID=UPI00254290CF|nr:hypothetical protein [Chondrinema litorale]UZS00129.1 hypothetical protein OQ292_39925 [Chondrinema litorale]
MKIWIIIFLEFIFDFSYSQPLVPQLPIKSVSINKFEEESIPLISELDQDNYYFRCIPYNHGVSIGRLSVKKNWFSSKWLEDYSKIPQLEEKLSNNSIGKSEEYNYLLSNELYPYNSFKFNGIYVSSKRNGFWSKPKKIPIKGINFSKVHSFYFSKALNVIIFSMKHKTSFGKEDLFVSEFNNNRWTKPINLGISVNSSRSDISPFLSEDMRYLYFSSETEKGDYDIFVCERFYDSWKVWSKPKRLSDNINSESDELYFCINADTSCFFISNKNSYADIFKAKLLKEKYHMSDKSSFKFMTKQEIQEILGTDVNLVLNFEENSQELNKHSKEILWYVVNKVKKMENINIFLEGSKAKSEEGDSYISTGRAINTNAFITSLGIENSRIYIESVDNKGSKVFISFFKFD